MGRTYKSHLPMRTKLRPITAHLHHRRIAQPALRRVSANLVLASYLDLAQAP